MIETSWIEIQIFGVHAVREALTSSCTKVHEIWCGGLKSTAINEIRCMAEQKKIPTRIVSTMHLATKLANQKHQGVSARVSVKIFHSVSHWFKMEEKRKLFLGLAVDGVVDPQNMGSLIRSAHFFGCDFFILPKDRCAPLTGVVAKASSGALFSMPMIRVTNLARELKVCAELGFFRIALVPEGQQTMHDLELVDRSILLVVGSEGEGLRRLTMACCDVLADLMKSKMRDSLNVSVAGSLALYEVQRQRKDKPFHG